MKSGFFDYFPTPKFLEMHSVGLSFSERAIRVVEIVKKNHRYELGRFGERLIPAGMIEGGYVHDKKEVSKILTSLKDELHLEFVRIVLPDEKAYLFKTEVPKISENDLRQAVEFRLEENVPLKASEAVFDFSLIPGNPSRDHNDVSVTVLPSKVVHTYLEIANLAGLKPTLCSIETDALCRAVVPEGDLDVFMIVNISENKTGLSIVNRGVAQVNITIPVGSDAITSAVGKHYSVSPEEAKKIKERYGFSKNHQNIELFLAITNTISAIKDEVNKMDEYWQSHRNPKNSDERKIRQVILCGKDANLSGLDEYLASALKTEVKVASVWQNIFSLENYIPKLSFLDALDYASAIGISRPD